MIDDIPGAERLLSERPTRVRYGVLGFLCSLAFVLYIDRICIGQAASHIEKELGISHSAMGWVFGAFTLAYGLFEVPTGHWGDRYGSRGVLTRIVIWWSFFTALTGAMWGFWSLVVVRFLFGAGEAGALPNAARVIARWFPAGGRGPAQGLIQCLALVGGAVAPPVAAYLIEHVGWRWAFFTFGWLGVVWAVAFYRWFRDDPHSHPDVNEGERALIASGGNEAPGGESHPPIPWGQVLSSANVWLLGGVITCAAFNSYMYFFWYPTYLKEARLLTEAESGLLAGMVLTGGAFGSLSGGFLADWLLSQTGNRRWSRSGIGCGALASGGGLLWSSTMVDDPTLAAACTSVAAFTAFSSIASWWGAVTDISGRHLGALFGLMNSMGVPGAFVSPIFLGWFVDWMKSQGHTGRAQWDPAFAVYSLVLLVGAVGWLFINPTRPVADAPEIE
jgi:MFS family permease